MPSLILTRAIDTVKDAISADVSGNYQVSFQLYKDAIELFLHALKEEDDSKNRQGISARVVEYLDRAEKIKIFIKEEEETDNPYATVTTTEKETEEESKQASSSIFDQHIMFDCPCCMDTLNVPVTLPCGHTACKCCLQTWFRDAKNDCPICRSKVSSQQQNELHINIILEDILSMIYPDLVEKRRLKIIEKQKNHLVAERQRIPNDLITYNADKDCRGGGTGREYVSNLGHDGTENWNKWFTGTLHSSATVTLAFREPQMLHQYTLCSANDVPARDPRFWEMWGRPYDESDTTTDSEDDDENKWVLLHKVDTTDRDSRFYERGKSFTSRWQYQSFDIHPINNEGEYNTDQISNKRYSAMKFKVLPGYYPFGIQLGHLHVYQLPGPYCEDLPILPSVPNSHEA